MSVNIDEIAAALFDIGCVKFGSFKLKSGLMSPIYLDLRLLVTHPRVLRAVGAAMAATVRERGLQFDRLAALPYAGLPIGVAVSLELERPLIYPRKEAKEYGTAKLIEGAYDAGEVALMVDDLITRGTAKIEALKPLLDEGLIVRDILVLIDREQGGAEELAARGVALHAVMTLTQVLDSLVSSDRLPPAKREEVLAWVASSR
jgi:uridine monophosphate synthetase